MVNHMREQAATTNHMMEHIERRLEENMGGHGGGAKVDLEYLRFPEFRKANPSSF